MKRIARTALGLWVVSLCLLGSSSCTDDKALPGACDYTLPDDSCAGVSMPEICSGTYCAEAAGLSCARTLYVKAGGTGGNGSAGNPFAELQKAADKAKAGDCIAVAAGSYSAASILGGVSLLGKGANAVTISGADAGVPALEIRPGKGGLIRGVTLSGEGRGLDLRDVDGLRVEQVRIDAVRVVGIHASNATNLVIDNVHVKNPRASAGSGAADAGIDAGPADAGIDTISSADAGADAVTMDAGVDTVSSADAGADAQSNGVTTKRGDGFGILLLDGSSANVTRTLVERSAVTGIYVIESSIHLESSAVIHSGYFGVAIADCLEDPSKPGGCKTAVPGSEVHRSSLAHNQVVGLLVKGVDLVARDNDISYTRLNFGAARNVQLHGDAAVTLEHNRIHNSDHEGVVVDGCTGTLQDNTIEQNQERGLWLQHIAQPGLKLTDNTISDNEWVGLGATQSVGVTVKGGLISNTRKRYTLWQGKPVEMGDGVQLLGKSSATIDGVQIQASGRIGLLIDDAKSTVTGTSITGGEELLVVQNANLGDQTLSVTGQGGTSITPKQPTTPYYVNSKPVGLISCDPIPLP